MTADNARRTGATLERMQQFLLWLVPTVEKLPVCMSRTRPGGCTRRVASRVSDGVGAPGHDLDLPIELPLPCS